MFTTASTHSIEDQFLFKFSSLLSLIDLFENKPTLCLHQEEICYAGTIVEEIASPADLYMPYRCSIHVLFSNDSIHVKNQTLKKKTFNRSDTMGIAYCLWKEQTFTRNFWRKEHFFLHSVQSNESKILFLSRDFHDAKENSRSHWTIQNVRIGAEFDFA